MAVVPQTTVAPNTKQALLKHDLVALRRSAKAADLSLLRERLTTLTQTNTENDHGKRTRTNQARPVCR